MATRQTKKAKPAAAQPKKLTPYEVHMIALRNGYAFYTATVTFKDGLVRNTRLWLRPKDVKDARGGTGFSKEFRDMVRQDIILHVTNTLHQNAMPQGEALPWSRIRLTCQAPPAKP